MRGDISKRGAALLEDLERRMQKADATIDARLRALNRCSRTSSGEVIIGPTSRSGKIPRTLGGRLSLNSTSWPRRTASHEYHPETGDIQAQSEQMQVMPRQNPRGPQSSRGWGTIMN